MVWVWPPHTSMNLYCRPGSHSEAIRAASALALSASRNSSTKRTQPPLLDPGFLQGRQLVGVGLADALQEVEGGPGLVLVDLRHGEAHVDQHPVPRVQLLAFQQADVDRPAHPADVDLGQVGAVGVHLDDLTRNAEAHARVLTLSRTPPRASSRLRRGCRGRP